MKKIIIFALFSLIVLLAVITRGVKLGEAPNGLYIDEAGQGYSAYSILKTGKDEFGMPWPSVFRSFTDFKTPVYIYLVVPLIPHFGLTPLTVRLPSFIFSILTLPVLYLLVKKLSKDTILSLITTLLLSISPWHILFGRTNFECNVALFFFLTGVLFFYYSLDKKYFLIFSAIFFAIALPAYHSQRILTPAIALLLFIRHRKTMFKSEYRPYLITSLIIGFVISIPTLYVMTTPGFLARASGLNIFSHSRQNPAGYKEGLGLISNFIFNNSIFLSFKEFVALYLSYFSPRNMFHLGDYGPRSSFPELSTFFIWQMPLYVYGLYLLLTKKIKGELRFVLLSMFLVAPIPAAVTRDPYTTIRALPLVISQILLMAFAINTIYKKLSRKIILPTSIGFVLIILYSLTKIWSSVIILNEYERASHWDYGWNEVVNVLDTLPKGIPIIVDTAKSEPYIEILFFKKYDPSVYQQTNNTLDLSEYYTNMVHNTHIKIDNIETRAINWEEDLKRECYLVGDLLAIGDEQITRHNLEKIKDIYYPDKSVAFRIVKVQPKK